MKEQVSLFWSFFIKRLNKNYFLIITQSQKHLLLHWLRITQKFISRKEITLFYNETTPMCFGTKRQRNTIAGIITDQHIHCFSFCQNCTSFSGQWSCSIDNLIEKKKDSPFTGLSRNIQTYFWDKIICNLLDLRHYLEKHKTQNQSEKIWTFWKLLNAAFGSSSFNALEL